MPRLTATLVSARFATLLELQTIYGVKDGYDLYEVVAVDNYNQRILNKAER